MNWSHSAYPFAADEWIDAWIWIYCWNACSSFRCCVATRSRNKRRRNEGARTRMECVWKYTKIERVWRSWFPSIVKKRCTAMIRILCLHGHYTRQTVDATRHTVPQHSHWKRCWASKRRRNEHQNDLCDTRNRNSYRWSGSLQSLSERCRGQRRSTLQKRKIDLRFVYLIVVHSHGIE